MELNNTQQLRIEDWESGKGNRYSIRDIEPDELVMRAIEVDGKKQLQTSQGCVMSFYTGLEFLNTVMYIKGLNGSKENALKLLQSMYGTHISGIEYEGSLYSWEINEIDPITGDVIVNDHILRFSTMERLGEFENNNNG